MKVVCIKKSNYNLTVGKIYDVDFNSSGEFSTWTNRPRFDYVIKDDVGYKHEVESSIFKNLDEYIKEKINEFGI